MPISSATVIWMLSIWRLFHTDSNIGLLKRKTKQILHRFFPQIVVDAVDLTLIEIAGDLFLQRFGGIQIVSKRFFNDDARPFICCLV